MEAIGGTGVPLNGLLSEPCGADREPIAAVVLADQSNRWTGYCADPHLQPKFLN